MEQEDKSNPSIDTYLVDNSEILDIINKYVCIDQSLSMGTISRRLPYMLAELGHCSGNPWTAYCYDDPSDHVLVMRIFSTTSHGEFPMSIFTITYKSEKDTHKSIVRTLRNIAHRPIKQITIKTSSTSCKESYELLSNCGKGILTIECGSGENVFIYNYYPIRATFDEWLWICWSKVWGIFHNQYSIIIKQCRPVGTYIPTDITSRIGHE